MLTYDILSDMAKEVFAVDGDSGQITTKIRLDRETKSVSADKSYSPGLCSILLIKNNTMWIVIQFKGVNRIKTIVK